MNHPGKFVRFHVERWIQRGVLHQLLFVGAIIVAISVGGGLIAWAATGKFPNPLDAIWWSFLRLTDPGYLGDDEGAVLRIVSTIVTVLGYVLFMGSLIAIMTQWLAQTIRRFESGMAPISMRGHVVILGWTNRTPEIVRELLIARGRLRRFLEANDQRILRVVIVADEVTADRRLELRSFLGEHWRSRQIFLRAGSELSLGDLQRFDLSHAAAIIVPGDEFRHGGTETADTNVVKTLLTLRPILNPIPEADRPQIVAEMFDPRKERAARRALPGRLEVVPGDAVIARLLAQAIRNRPLVAVFLELLSHARGCSPYVRSFPELTGGHPSALDGRFDRAVVIGAVRIEAGRPVTHLNPPPGFRLERDDLLVLIARSSEDLVIARDAGFETPSTYTTTTTTTTTDRQTRRVLVLGWSSKVGSVLEELGRAEGLEVEVTLVSRLPRPMRDARLEGFGWDPARVRLEHLEKDYTVSGVLEEIDPGRFDSILLLASTEMPTAQGADARTIMGYELVKSFLEERIAAGGNGPEVIVEFVDPESEHLFSDASDVMLMSPKILGHLQTHVALRGELGSVFSELFVTGGVEVAVRSPGDYGLSGPVVYREVEQAAATHGEIALGVMKTDDDDGERIELCPSPDGRWSADDGGSLIVLAAADADR